MATTDTTVEFVIIGYQNLYKMKSKASVNSCNFTGSERIDPQL